ncbi:unnamed protein product [Ostreobium quekettii]|uniref:RAP domain-containing protein n=1 Tax=Ostreobium quekettii TaxID=121088 RepID=A0A8S1JCK2_9CHLO|nr:unnamed protein product [Ostreobium quekettii]|eukprot:evm.model.scf_559.2 EVM.evm.TU.scf_559.2   scf_559:14622-18550(-)
MLIRWCRGLPALGPMPDMLAAVALSTVAGAAPMQSLQPPLEDCERGTGHKPQRARRQEAWLEGRQRFLAERSPHQERGNANFVDFRSLDCKKIEEVFLGLGSNVSGYHLAAAFARLKKINERPPGHLLDALAQLTMHVGEARLHVRDSVSIFSSCASIGYFNSDLCNFLGGQIIKFQDFMGAREVGDLIHGITTLRKDWYRARSDKLGSRHTPPVWNEEEKMFGMEDDLLSCAISRVSFQKLKGASDPSALTSIMVGLGQMGCGSERVLGELARTVTDRRILMHMKARDLAQFLVSFARLRYKGEAIDILAQRAVGCLDHFNELELSNIAHSLGQVAYTNRAVLGVLAKEMANPQRLHRYIPQGLGMVLHGLANCHFSEFDVINALAKECSRPARLEASSAQDLAVVIYSLGKMGFRKMGIFVVLVGEAVKPCRLPQFTGHGLANILYGMAKTELCLAGLVLPLAKEIARSDRLREFSEQGLSNILYSFGLLGFKDPAILHQVAVEVMCPRRLRRFTNQALANILYGLSLSRFGEVGLLAPLNAEATDGRRMSHYPDQGLIAMMFACGQLGLREPVPALLKEFFARVDKVSLTGRVAILSALGNLNYRDNQVVAMLLGDLLSMNVLRQLRTKHIGDVLRALARLDYRDDDAVAVLVNEASTPHRLPDFLKHRFTRLVHSLGTLGYTDCRIWGLLVLEGIRRAPSWTPWEMARALVGYAKGKVQSLPLWEKAVVEMQAEGWFDDCVASDAAKIAWALGEVGFYAEGVFTSLVDKFTKEHEWREETMHEATSVMFACGVHNHCSDSLIKHSLANLLWDAPKAGADLSKFWDPPGLATAAWYLAVVDHLDSGTFSRLCQQMVQLEKTGHVLGHEDLNQLFLGHLCAKLDSVDAEGTLRKEVAQALESKEVSSLLLRAREGYLQHLSPQCPPSDAQNTVLLTLDRLGMSYRPNPLLKEACLVVDAELVGERTVVMVEGPDCFTSNKPASQHRRRGSAVLRNRLLGRQGWKVVCVPFYAWEHLDESGQEDYLRSALREQGSGERCQQGVVARQGSAEGAG